MTTINKLTEKEYNLIIAAAEAIAALTKEGGRGSNIEDFFNEKDVTESDFDGVLYDINNDTLIECIKAFKSGTLEAAAMDSDGVGFTVITTLETFYNNVFGFTEWNGEKTFYLCQVQESYNEELEQDENTFFVDNEPVTLENCIRMF